mmetsp:Transcript_35509/g.78075  ORF Transcript_35509/g.78075 Transcript_35509/m.78075 type:complete len:328 (-) Transcript_35509:132-1115(-)
MLARTARTAPHGIAAAPRADGVVALEQRVTRNNGMAVLPMLLLASSFLPGTSAYSLTFSRRTQAFPKHIDLQIFLGRHRTQHATPSPSTYFPGDQGSVRQHSHRGGRSSRVQEEAAMCSYDDLLKTAAMDDDAADLGGAASSAAEGLSQLQMKGIERLRAMGASTDPPAEKQMPRRRQSEFVISNSAATAAESRERLRRLRAKDLGELEEPNLTRIESARTMAKQWLFAGLHARAEQELESVAQFVSYRSELGGAFQLELARVKVQCGKQREADRIRQRIQQENTSSSMRWQAERELREAHGSSAPSTSTEGNPEMSQLFRMPTSWD